MTKIAPVFTCCSRLSCLRSSCDNVKSRLTLPDVSFPFTVHTVFHFADFCSLILNIVTQKLRPKILKLQSQEINSVLKIFCRHPSSDLSFKNFRIQSSYWI